MTTLWCLVSPLLYRDTAMTQVLWPFAVGFIAIAGVLGGVILLSWMMACLLMVALDGWGSTYGSEKVGFIIAVIGFGAILTLGAYHIGRAILGQPL